MASIEISTDIKGAQEALAGTSKSLASIQRQVLGIVSKGIVAAIKAAISSSDLEKRTGELLKCYRYKVKKDGSEANVFPKALNGEKSIYPKVMALNYGIDKGNRHLKPRAFISSGDTYAESGAYDEEIQKMIDKELNKYWGK